MRCPRSLRIFLMNAASLYEMSVVESNSHHVSRLLSRQVAILDMESPMFSIVLPIESLFFIVSYHKTASQKIRTLVRRWRSLRNMNHSYALNPSVEEGCVSRTSDLPAGSSMTSQFSILIAHLPEVKASPEQKSGDSKRQTQSEIYLNWVQMSIRVWL